MGKKGASAAPRAVPVASTSDNSWLDTLTADDRQLALATGCTNATALELEKKKKEERKKKAEDAQQKQLWENERKRQWEEEQRKKILAKEREEKKWQQQVEAAKQRAKKEGVLEAHDYGDGVWYVELEGGKWQEVQGQYYCKLCDKHLNDSSLEVHLDSSPHRKKVESNMPDSTSASRASTATSSTASPPRAPKVSASGSIDAWQQRCSDGSFRCVPCNKVIDDCHLGTSDHKRRLQSWQEQQDLARSGYAPPALQYLAWVPADDNEPTGDRWLKCLLCDKWCQDETSHIGIPDAPSGSKDHQKNLRNYSFHRENIIRKRQQYHPQAPPTVSTVQQTRAAAPALATPAPWAPAGGAPPAPPAPWAPGRAVAAHVVPSGLDATLEEC